jgi:phosphatidyl-myo-inositol alpha-mannosyltransferase
VDALDGVQPRDIELVGYVSDEELPRYYRIADVFCAPSTGYEALGIVLLEAMASGTPVVTTDIEGYRTVVTHGRDALVVPPAQSAPLADAIISVLQGPELGQRMSEEGRRTVEQYDWPVLARRLVDLYERSG